MEIQSIIVAMIFLLAVFFIAKGFFKKIKSFAPKNSCGKTDCGCGK